LNVIAQSSEILRKNGKKDDFASDSDVKSIDKSMIINDHSMKSLMNLKWTNPIKIRNT